MLRPCARRHASHSERRTASSGERPSGGERRIQMSEPRASRTDHGTDHRAVAAGTGQRVEGRQPPVNARVLRARVRRGWWSEKNEEGVFLNWTPIVYYADYVSRCGARARTFYSAFASCCAASEELSSAARPRWRSAAACLLFRPVAPLSAVSRASRSR